MISGLPQNRPAHAALHRYGEGAALPSSPADVDDGGRYVHSHGKRLVDIVVATLILIAALPALLVIAALVKFTSPGPVIFKQSRNGVGGCFNIYKFRTMYDRPEDASDKFLKQACRGDSRVTKVGYWLRRLSLDELPQVFNVLQGKMSIVGPRPHALGHDQYYANHVAHYMRRYDCRPGITGLAQVSGSRGETGTHADMQRRVQFDLRYIDEASFRMDMVIILRTAAQLVKNDHVY